MDRVRLQILLKKPLADDTSLVPLLEQHGLKITGTGVTTVTATVSQERYKKMFGKSPDVRSGFSTGIGDVLAVPDALAPYVESISETPKHLPLSE